MNKLMRWLKGGYEHGWLGGGRQRARRHVRTGVVEIPIPWAKTETWVAADSSHWPEFTTEGPVEGL